jgi:hypothetical protein
VRHNRPHTRTSPGAFPHIYSITSSSGLQILSNREPRSRSIDSVVRTATSKSKNPTILRAISADRPHGDLRPPGRPQCQMQNAEILCVVVVVAEPQILFVDF